MSIAVSKPMQTSKLDGAQLAPNQKAKGTAPAQLKSSTQASKMGKATKPFKASKGPLPSFMRPTKQSNWVMWISIFSAIFGVFAPVLVGFVVSSQPSLVGVHAAQFSLVIPPGYWFVDLSAGVGLVMAVNALLMIGACLTEEPGAFLLNALVGTIVLVAVYVLPQFVDLSCKNLSSGCIPSSVHFIWR